MHIHEPRSQQPVLERVPYFDDFSKLRRGVVAHLLPLLQVHGAGDGVILGFNPCHGLLELEPAAGMKILVALAAEAVPVVDCAGAKQSQRIDALDEEEELKDKRHLAGD